MTITCREFLTGFHKRKLQRKKKGQEKLENELKEERKRLKIKAKESYKKLFLSNRNIPELETTYNEVYDDEDVTVEVKELADNNLHYNTTSLILSNYNKSEDDRLSNACEDEEECDMDELKRQGKQNETSNKQPFTSKKGVKKELRKMATKNLQNSKVFKKKNKVERVKQRKKSLKQKNEKIKQQKKLGKKHNHKKRP